MNILLTGATGYIGSAVAEKLIEAGHIVRGLSRNEDSDARLRERGITPVRGDLTDPAALAAEARTADGVVHTAFVHNFGNYNGAVETDRAVTAALAEALAGSEKPYVATSGTGFLGETGPTPVDESFPPNPESPFRHRAVSEGEALKTAKHGVRSVVIRLPLYVYGRGGSSFVPTQLTAAHRDGIARYIGEGGNRLSAVHVEDAARLFVLALEKAPAGSLYHGSTEFDITGRQLAEAVAANLKVPVESVTRERATEIFGPVMVEFFAMNNQTSSEKAVRELGWTRLSTTNLLDDIAAGSYVGFRPKGAH